MSYTHHDLLGQELIVGSMVFCTIEYVGRGHGIKVGKVKRLTEKMIVVAISDYEKTVYLYPNQLVLLHPDQEKLVTFMLLKK